MATKQKRAARAPSVSRAHAEKIGFAMIASHFKAIEEIAREAQRATFLEAMEDAADDIFLEMEKLDRLIDVERD